MLHWVEHTKSDRSSVRNVKVPMGEVQMLFDDPTSTAFLKHTEAVCLGVILRTSDKLL